MREGRELPPEAIYGQLDEMEKLVEASRETEPSKEDEFIGALHGLIASWKNKDGTPIAERAEEPKEARVIGQRVIDLLKESGADQFSAIGDREEIFSIVFDYLKTKEQDAVMRAFSGVDLTDDEQRQALADNLADIAAAFSYPIEEIYERMHIGPEHGGNIVLD